MGCHSAGAAELLGSQALVDAVLSDYRSAPITGQEKALLEFVDKVNGSAQQIGAADVEEAVAAGCTDEMLYDAIAVCALFNFYNRWVGGAGIRERTAEEYRLSGKRIAARGYAVTKSV